MPWPCGGGDPPALFGGHEVWAIAQAAYARLEELDLSTTCTARKHRLPSENVGFALPGTCYYNIASIAETEPVLGVGAGAASSWSATTHRDPEQSPDPNQYLERRATRVRRKPDGCAGAVDKPRPD